MIEKQFVIISLFGTHPLYLTPGKAPLFDNFQITGMDLHFSSNLSGAIRCSCEAEAEVWVQGMLYAHPRFVPLSVMPVYYPVVQVLVNSTENKTVG